MDSRKEEPLLFCLYCEECISNHEDITDHECFHNYDASIHYLITEERPDNIEYVSFSECNPNAVNEEDKSEYDKQDVDVEKHIANSESKNITKNSNKMFTSEMEEKLISLVQLQSPLYDFRMDVKDRKKVKKDALWDKIAFEFNNSKIDGVFCDNKWKYLRDCFNRAENEYQKRIYQTKKSGSAAQEVKKPSFRHYNQMLFLKDVTKPKVKSCSSLSLQTKHNSSSTDSGLNYTSPTQQGSISLNNHRNSSSSNDCEPSSKRSKDNNSKAMSLNDTEVESLDETFAQSMSSSSCKKRTKKKDDDIEHQLMKYLTADTKSESTEVDIYLRAAAKTINNFRPDLRRDCIRHIQNVVYDFQVQNDAT